VSGELFEGKTDFTGRVEHIDLTKFVPSANFNQQDIALLNAVRKLQRSEIDKYVSRNSPFSGIWENIIYSEEEGFDPRKLFVRNNGNFVLEAELLDIRDRMYHSPLSKKKNPLSIVNDTELSSIAKNCGF
jgi:hypothetical protein